MNDQECKDKQYQAVKFLEKIDQIPIDLLERLPELYDDVKTLKEDFEQFKDLAEIISKAKIWINRLPWIIVVLVVSGFDYETGEKLLKVFLSSGAMP